MKSSSKNRKYFLLAFLVLLLVFFVIAKSFPKNKNLECVPSSCCHATSCVEKSQAQDCRGIACTQECKPGTLDCGQGECKAVNGKCEASWKKANE